MRLATFALPGSENPVAGEVRDDTVVAFADGSTVVDRLASGDRRPATGEEHALGDVRLLAPVSRPPAIFCIGRNYLAHNAEMGNTAPPAPIVFLKLGPSSVAPNDPVGVPAAARGKLDYEGEMVAVIGGGGAVAGYAIADDLSARDIQQAEPQWTRAKGFDASCPWGPWITTADEVADPEALALKTWVNGELRQHGTTADLIFSIDRLVEVIGETCTLEPGAIILTGTPSGVGTAMDPPRYLASGDTIRIEIESLGAIEHAIA